ncbi:hypothetical protein CYMTET_5575 [Cymbomonas tetramitiformis]|uniref:Uncharacterized protein n=1 Tax=Cymbomonas tetramitiformis TaxID=36881 RepID=A0AAE0GZ49_9CHLO|nr:hypothetical protein CYMTET_5575 [Cymbomonas tetramitiformis]
MGSPSPVVVKCEDGARGRSAFASRDFKAGEVIISEAPLCAVQLSSSRSKLQVCSYCLQPVGTLLSQLKHFAGKANREGKGESALDSLLDDAGFPLVSEADSQLTPIFCCSSGCGEVYCSKTCAGLGLESGHHFLCEPTPSDTPASNIVSSEQPVESLKKYSASNQECFWLAACIIARAACTLK